MNKREVGSRFEEKAAAFLKQKGYEIIRRNFRCRLGEIDLIARDGEYLVFAEVKYRRNLSHGRPAESVTAAKIRRIRGAAAYYLLTEHGGAEPPCRFDVVEILGDQISHMKNAF